MKPVDKSYKISKSPKLAFSLVEISVVILIIGLLIAGISKGVDLYADFKLTTARNLTNNSRVGRIPDLVFWLETTEENNFKSSLVANINTTAFGKINNNFRISAWRDRNPNAVNKNIVIANNDNRRPTYVIDGINGLPSLKFDSTLVQYLFTTNAPIPNGDDDYTIIAVSQVDKSNSYDWGYVVAQGQSTPSIEGSMGSLANNGRIGFIGFYKDWWLPSSFVAKPIQLGVIRVDNSLTANLSIFFNSTIPVNGPTPSIANDLNIIAESFFIGSRPPGIFPFKGLISEIIIFERALNDSEIQDIISYLAKKYNVKLN